MSLIPGTLSKQESIARQSSSKDGHLISTQTATSKKKLEGAVILSFQALISLAHTLTLQGLLRITPSALSSSMPPIQLLELFLITTRTSVSYCLTTLWVLHTQLKRESKRQSLFTTETALVTSTLKSVSQMRSL